MKKFLLITLSAFWVRTLWLYQNLFFGFEQGRDFLKMKEILSGNLALIGPKTDLDGVFHGVGSYYFYLPAYVISDGNPYLMLLMMIAIHALSVYLLYRAVEVFFNKRVAIMSVIFYIFSYSSIIYSRWLIHENLSPALIIMIFYMIAVHKKNKYVVPIISVLWFSLLHINITPALLMFVPFMYLLYVQKIKISKKLILYFIIIAFVAMSPYIIFNFKNNGIIVNGISKFLSSKGEGVRNLKIFDEFKNEIVDGTIPQSRYASLIIFTFASLLVLAKSLKDRKASYIVLAIFYAPVMFFIISFAPLRHFFIYMPVFLAILYAYTLNIIFDKRLVFISVVVALTLAGFHLSYTFDHLPESKANFIYHAQRTFLSDELNLLDYVYKDADGKEFSYDYYSVPYWKIEGWKYLFDWYGQSKYGYQPREDRTETFYVLIEPDETQPLYQENWHKDMDKVSEIIDVYQSHSLKAEKRKVI